MLARAGQTEPNESEKDMEVTCQTTTSLSHTAPNKRPDERRASQRVATGLVRLDMWRAIAQHQNTVSQSQQGQLRELLR